MSCRRRNSRLYSTPGREPVIYRRYGTAYQSVDMHFEAKALNEVGFRRNREHTIPADEFDAAFDHLETVELSAEAEGPVQTETEQLLLDRLQQQVEAILARLAEGGVLVIENESGHDYPKMRQAIKNVMVEGENRLRFEYTMAPPLRAALYAPRS